MFTSVTTTLGNGWYPSSSSTCNSGGNLLQNDPMTRKSISELIYFGRLHKNVTLLGQLQDSQSNAHAILKAVHIRISNMPSNKNGIAIIHSNVQHTFYMLNYMLNYF